MVLMLMIFCHLIDDYVLQGWLASAKQKSWWEKNAPQELYKHDFLMALMEHSFMNAFAVHVPIYLFMCKNENILVMTFLFSLLSHMIIDHLKANKRKINLIHDQLLHIIILIIIYLFYSII